MLRWWGFSDAFRNEMVFPLTALFFGTGNQVGSSDVAVAGRLPLLSAAAVALLQAVLLPLLQRLLSTDATTDLHCNRCGRCCSLQTPHVSAAIVARVFLDPQLRCGSRLGAAGWLHARAAWHRCQRTCLCVHYTGLHLVAAAGPLLLQAVPVLAQAAAGRGAHHVCLPQAVHHFRHHCRPHSCHRADRWGDAQGGQYSWTDKLVTSSCSSGCGSEV